MNADMRNILKMQMKKAVSTTSIFPSVASSTNLLQTHDVNKIVIDATYRYETEKNLMEYLAPFTIKKEYIQHRLEKMMSNPDLMSRKSDCKSIWTVKSIQQKDVESL